MLMTRALSSWSILRGQMQRATSVILGDADPYLVALRDAHVSHSLPKRKFLLGYTRLLSNITCHTVSRTTKGDLNLLVLPELK